MYTKEQEEIALREYERLGSIAAVIRRLGYPSESTLYRWYERKKAGLENRHGHTEESPTEMDHHCNTSGHPRYPIVNTGCTLPSAWTFSATSPEKSSRLTAVVFHL